MLEKIADPAVEEAAKLINGRQLDPGGGFPVKGRDRAAVEAGSPCHIGDAELVPAHQAGEVAADHFLRFHRGDAQNSKISCTENLFTRIHEEAVRASAEWI